MGIWSTFRTSPKKTLLQEVEAVELEVELFSFVLHFLCVPLPALGFLMEVEPLVLAVAVTLLAATRVTLALPTTLAAECLGSESSAF